MQFNTTTLKSKLNLIGSIAILFSLVSCGSFQYVGYDNDGVYGEEEVEYVEVTRDDTNNQNSQYYENYFKEKSDLYTSESNNAIFTDVDSYSSDYEETENDSIAYKSGYAGWGEDPDQTTININYYSGFYFNNFWRYRSIWNPRWWNYGYSNNWGPGFYEPFWYPTYYYGPSIYVGFNPWWNAGFYNPYWNNIYYSNNFYYRGGRALAYNAGRRGSLYANSNLTSRTRRSSINPSTSELSRRVNSNSTRIRTNSTRPRVNNSTRPTTRPRVRPNSSITRPKVNRNKPSSHISRGRPGNTNRATTTKRSNSRSNRSGSINSRSNSSRSSGNTSRSSSSRSNTRSTSRRNN